MNSLKRMLLGNAGEDLLILEMEACKFAVVRTGQEHWLPKRLRKMVRKKKSPMGLMISHFPDILGLHDKFPLAYWDAKVNTVSGTPYFTLGVSFYLAATARQLKGERVVVAFYDTDRKWYANWIEALEPVDEKEGKDGTYLLIAKSSTLPMRMFVAVNVLNKRWG